MRAQYSLAQSSEVYFQWLYLILLKESAGSQPLSEDHNVMQEYSKGVIVNMLQICVKPALANLKIDPLPDTAEQMPNPLCGTSIQANYWVVPQCTDFVNKHLVM